MMMINERDLCISLTLRPVSDTLKFDGFSLVACHGHFVVTMVFEQA